MDEFLNSIVHGDCVEGLNGLPAESIDLAFADPPFNIGYDYDIYQDKLGREKYLQWSRDWIAATHRVLKPNGTFWLAIGDEYAAELKLLSQEIGFHSRSWIIWYYTFGVNCKQKFTRSHAHLFYFVKDPQRFTFRADELENRIPSARELVYNDKRANPKGRLPDDTWIIRPEDVVGEMMAEDGTWSSDDLTPKHDSERTWTLRPQDLQGCFKGEEDTWYFPRVAGTFKERQGFHGCQMPEQLLGRIIRSCSNSGDVVIDPFSGSATTLAAAKKLNRKFVGFELSEDYVNYGRGRLEQIRVGDPLDGSAEPTKSAPATKAISGKSSRSKEEIGSPERDPSEERLAEAQLQIVLTGIIEAFQMTHDGFSVDRVVADPALNDEFVETCRRLGLAGEPRTWNSLLFRLRKSGKLAHIETVRATSMNWLDVDPFLHASEIALQSLLNDELATSLDEILVDPLLAKKFDDLARQFAPGRSSFEMRWAALKIRKQSKTARQRGAILTAPKRIGKAIVFSELDVSQIPSGPGVYLLRSKQKNNLYAGETLNLQQRLALHFNSSHPVEVLPENTTIQIFPTQTRPSEILAWQSCFVRTHKPSWNYQELG
ncbi:DNA methyltransferase [Thalassoglobus sp. JC818]|uniref:DNA methyltransferase n=1 Tax=Thalassoglobus sp. JC818 TaxID=3232136 RepID=UPI003458F4CE